MRNSTTVLGFGLPIETVEPEEDMWLLLDCPEQGGWHTAVHFGGLWLDFGILTLELEPTRWLPVPADPDEGPPKLDIIRGGHDGL